MSAFIYRLEGSADKFVSRSYYEDVCSDDSNRVNEARQSIAKFTGGPQGAALDPIHVDISFVDASDRLDIDAFKDSRPEYVNAQFLMENGKFIVGREVEKMSKSKYNVVNPDAICEEYGADSLRLYEMFLGPLEQAKPWNTAGITGVHGFLKKLWRLYHSGPEGAFYVSDAAPAEQALKILHKTIKKAADDIEAFSFNTTVSTFMICVNELSAIKCHARAILEPLAVLVSPYAPHIAEELWENLGNATSVSTAPFPEYEEKYLQDATKEYPVSFNGKMRFTLSLATDLSREEIEAAVMGNDKTKAQLQGNSPKKVIVVPGKIVNIVF
jgi:leucyl-tRNA synthetase